MSIMVAGMVLSFNSVQAADVKRCALEAENVEFFMQYKMRGLSKVQAVEDFTRVAPMDNRSAFKVYQASFAYQWSQDTIAGSEGFKIPIFAYNYCLKQ